jgi:D-glycero-D-manno-heptose 1,7-bisphosphate phosphatase
MREHKLAPYKDFAVCPHDPKDKCECRKPSGKMILDLIDKYHLNPEHSFMLGDKDIDVDAGKNAGVTGVKVRNESPTLLEFAKSLKKN